MLWMFGSELALYWGEKRFLRYYLSCGIGAGLLIATLPFIPSLAGWWSPTADELAKSTLGASGAIIAVLLAFSFTWPDRTIQLIFPPIPLKAIWLIPLVLVFEFATGSEDVSHVGHLGGLAIGWIYLLKEGKTPGVPTIETLKLFFQRHTTPKKSNAIRPQRRRTLKVRYQRYVMRKKLRSVQDEERTEPGRKKDDRTRR
jgi:membrane associated rhomboid family serine protease